MDQESGIVSLTFEQPCARVDLDVGQRRIEVLKCKMQNDILRRLNERSISLYNEILLLNTNN